MDAGAAPLTTTRHWDAVTRTIDRRRLGPVTVPMAAATGVVVLGSMLTFVAASGRDVPVAVVVAIVGAVITGLIGAAVNAFGRPAAARRAFEAFVYLGEWELDRVAALAGRRMNPTPDAMRKLLATTEERPEDRWLRVELLIVGRDLHEARAVAGRMPESTPYERVERAAAFVLIDWLSGGRGDPAPIREALADVAPAEGDERRRAEIILALAEVRQLVGMGAEPAAALAPLERARDRLGRAGDDALIRMTRRAAPSFVQTAGAFVVLLLVLDWIGVV